MRKSSFPLQPMEKKFRYVIALVISPLATKRTSSG
jgi:hypothetical protein